MSGKKDKVPKYSNDDLMHTYTPRSHEELLRNFSINLIKTKDAQDVKRENAYLKKQLSSLKKQLKREREKVSSLEDEKRKESNARESTSYTESESRSEVQSEKSLDNDEEYAKSWEVLNNHFNEVIRRHNEALAEKDRQIRELQERQHQENAKSKDQLDEFGSLNSLVGKSFGWMVGNNQRHSCYKFKSNKTGVQKESDTDFRCEDGCNCCENGKSDCREDSPVHSGEILTDHFSDVIRRHKQQLQERDALIRELQDALELCIGQKMPKKVPDESEVQLGSHDYHDQSQTSFGAKELDPGSAPPVEPPRDGKFSNRGYVDAWPSYATPTTTTSSDEEAELDIGSADTFAALEKCQRLEAIANLEKLRQNLVERLELEEKLDKLYWQTELNRYRELREEAGDSFDPGCSLNKDFEMLESTRLEMLRALRDVKDSAEAGPEIYVRPHSLIKDSGSIVKNEVEFSDYDNQRRVTFTEEVRISSTVSGYQSRHDS